MKLRGLLLGVLILAGCKHLEDPPPPPFQVAVTVTADKDKGSPVADVAVTRNSREMGKTDKDGHLTLTFHGSEGDKLDVWVKCPEGYRSPDRPITVTLLRLSDGKMAEYPATCEPSERKVVVSITADNGSFIPVFLLGKQVATLDESGAATFMLTGHPGEHLDFRLDTADEKFRLLQPQNPTVQLDVQGEDHIYPLDQPFKKLQIKKTYVGVSHPVQIGPRPL
jgi:hypothetical protein